MDERQNVASKCCDTHAPLLRAIGTAVATLVMLAISVSAPADEPKEQKRELLAEQEAVAQFDGLRFQRCSNSWASSCASTENSSAGDNPFLTRILPPADRPWAEPKASENCTWIPCSAASCSSLLVNSPGSPRA